MHTLFAVLGLLVALPSAQAQVVTCYNDDSLESINRDEFSFPLFPALPGRASPADCRQGPAVIGLRGSITIDGALVYDSFRHSDPAIEARVSPLGFVAILTQQGLLYLAQKHGRHYSAREWFDGRGGGVIAFALSRTGQLLAVRSDRSLIANGQARFNGENVMDLRAARNGTIVALLERGRLVDHQGHSLRRGANWERIISAKISTHGTVYYLMEDGSLGSTQDEWLFRNLGERVVSFKVSESDDVAFATNIGRLYRNRGERLTMGTATVLRYDISGSGRITAIDSAGRSYTF